MKTNNMMGNILLVRTMDSDFRLFNWCEHGGPVDPMVFIEKSKVIFSSTTCLKGQLHEIFNTLFVSPINPT
jgi:hypothetical protein